MLEGSAPSGSVPEPTRSPTAADPSPGQVRDLFSGRTLTLDEFEDAMGYSHRSQLAWSRERVVSTSSEGEVPAATARRLTDASGTYSPGRTGFAGWLERAGILGRSADRDGGPTASPRGGAASDGLPGVPVKCSVHGKRNGPHPRVRMVQRLEAHSGVIWAAQFSRNGRYVASAGQDHIVRVWEVCTAAGAAGDAGTESADGVHSTPRTVSQKERVLLNRVPYRLFSGHKQDVLDLSWSKTQFLLSASMDKTVRLWHVTMDQCLRVFKHSDFVTAIDFHPDDDRTFVSGSIDGKVKKGFRWALFVSWCLPVSYVVEMVNSPHDKHTPTN